MRIWRRLHGEYKEREIRVYWDLGLILMDNFRLISCMRSGIIYARFGRMIMVKSKFRKYTSKIIRAISDTDQ